MTIRTETRTAFVPTAPRRRGFLARILGADANYRQARRMADLTNAQRRDMGLPQNSDPVSLEARANMRFLSGQW